MPGRSGGGKRSGGEGRGGGGADERDGRVWRDTLKSHKWPTVPWQQHLPRRLPPSSLPGNRTPLKASARAIQRCVCVRECVHACVCYITKKVFFMSHTCTESARCRISCGLTWYETHHMAKISIYADDTSEYTLVGHVIMICFEQMLF